MTECGTILSKEQAILSLAKNFNDEVPTVNNLDDINLRVDSAQGIRFSCGRGFSLPIFFIGARYQSGSKESDALTIVFSGAVSRESVRPTFHRISWYESFRGNVLYVGDPMLDLHPELELAWYLGNEEVDCISIISQLAKQLCKNLKIDKNKCYSYGSSGGGFAALNFSLSSEYFKTIAINPQISLENFTQNVVSLYAWAAHNTTRCQFLLQYPESAYIGKRILDRKKKEPIIILQNINDSFLSGQVDLFSSSHNLKYEALFTDYNIRIIPFYRSHDHGPEKKIWLNDIYSLLESKNHTKSFKHFVTKTDGELLVKNLKEHIHTLAKKERPRILQIGACDGISFDPIFKVVKETNAKCCFVEPLPHLFYELKKNYSFLSDAIFLQTAVSDKDGFVKIRYVMHHSIKEKKVPNWALGIGTIEHDKNAMDGVRVKSQETANSIKQNTASMFVPCISLPGLLNSVNMFRPNIIIMDCEGHDYTILKSIPWRELSLDIVYFEVLNMDPDERETIFSLANNNGFNVYSGEDDCMLVSKEIDTDSY